MMQALLSRVGFVRNFLDESLEERLRPGFDRVCIGTLHSDQVVAAASR